MGMRNNNQFMVLEIIREYIDKNKISPTVREICDISEIKSISTVHKYIKRLESLGYINKKNNSPRSIRLTGKI